MRGPRSRARPVRFWWVRHAPVTGHADRVYGGSDVPADVSDAALFARLAARLPRRAVAVTSGLVRTAQTLDAVLEAGWRARRGEVLPALNEQWLGDWQGRPLGEIFGPSGPAAGGVSAETRPAGGESFVDLVERVRPAMAGLAEAPPARDVVVFSHGGTIRAALVVALGVAPGTALSFSVGHCSITRIDRIGGQWRVECVNAPP